MPAADHGHASAVAHYDELRSLTKCVGRWSWEEGGCWLTRQVGVCLASRDHAALADQTMPLRFVAVWDGVMPDTRDLSCPHVRRHTLIAVNSTLADATHPSTERP